MALRGPVSGQAAPSLFLFCFLHEKRLKGWGIDLVTRITTKPLRYQSTNVIYGSEHAPEDG